MKSILALLDKHFKVVVISLFFLIFVQNCSQSGKISTEAKNNKAISEKIAILEKNSITTEQLQILLEIHSLETARKVVYDNNTIIRTTQRPDDVMNAYDQKIKDLKSKLK